MSDLSNVQEDENKKTPQKRSTTTMFVYIREIIFLFALAFTSYATLFNSLAKVGKPPSPIPFFPASSVVQDYYRGTMGGAFEQASQSDIAVVMFYAPWDAESQSARPMFDAVARFLRDEVYFAAVSCWAPSSECRHHYPKIRSFPVIVVYPQQGSGIQYKGPLLASHLIRFIRAMIRPIYRVQSLYDIAKLFDTFNAVIVGSFDFEGNLGGKGYYTFYSSALKMLESDVNHDIAFAVTTNSEDATSIQVDQTPNLRLFQWNGTTDFSLDADYNEDTVVKWLSLNKYRPAKWMHLPGLKSTNLAPYLTTGPALIVFTPGHPLLSINPVFSLVRELSFKYYNCDKNAWVSQIANNLENINRNLKSTYQRQELKCSRLKQLKKDINKSSRIMMSTVIATTVLSNRTDCDVCKSEKKFMGPQLEFCALPPNINASKIRYDTSMWRTEQDDLSGEALYDMKEYEECRLLEAAQNINKIWFPPTQNNINGEIKGAACINNRTLSFIALDSLLHYQLAEGLGVNVLEAREKTAVLIVDAKAESQYLLKEHLTEQNLVNFILNHTYGNLQRHIRSTNDAEDQSLFRNSYPVISNHDCRHSETESCVQELHSRNFLSTVMDSSKAVIVFYHSPLCAMCRSVSHIFLLLARYFRHFPSLVFTRIDGERNDLPWEYTIDIYPTILLFPASRKTDSRVFSDNLPFTVRNIMHFILANLETEAKIPAMLSVCQSFEKYQSRDEALSCKSKAHAQTQEGLSRTLLRMRSVMSRLASSLPHSHAASALYREKSELMLSLQYYRAVGFILGSKNSGSKATSDVNELYLKFLKRGVS